MIIDSIPYSEEWFVQTYEKLMKAAGKGLHSVDFKDFIQLSTVLTDEKECFQLLRTLTKPPDTLVSAASNLWKSISGVKWLFEAKRLLKFNNGPAHQQQFVNEDIELQKVVELDLRAKQFIGINYEAEIARATQYSRLFAEFQKLVSCIKLFDEKFGNYQKLIRTLESN